MVVIHHQRMGKKRFLMIAVWAHTTSTKQQRLQFIYLARLSSVTLRGAREHQFKRLFIHNGRGIAQYLSRQCGNPGIPRMIDKKPTEWLAKLPRSRWWSSILIQSIFQHSKLIFPEILFTSLIVTSGFTGVFRSAIWSNCFLSKVSAARDIWYLFYGLLNSMQTSGFLPFETLKGADRPTDRRTEQKWKRRNGFEPRGLLRLQVWMSDSFSNWFSGFFRAWPLRNTNQSLTP